MAKKTEPRCSFCNKPKSQCVALISGIDGNICESCIDQAHTILTEEFGYGTNHQSTAKNGKNTTIESYDQSKVLKPLELKKTLGRIRHWARRNQKSIGSCSL